MHKCYNCCNYVIEQLSTGRNVVTEQWLNHLQITADLHDWPDAFAFQVAKSQFKFWLRRSNGIKDWNSFKMDFRKTFTSETCRADLWKNVQNRIDSSGESIENEMIERKMTIDTFSIISIKLFNMNVSMLLSLKMFCNWEEIALIWHYIIVITENCFIQL